MKKTKRSISRELGLEIGSICGKYFFKIEHLHYGYWTGKYEVELLNLPLAQEEYANFIVSHIPKGVSSILDVGCGTGQVARRLLDMGYKVDCVSPSPYLKQRAGELLGEQSHIFECFYEDIETDNRYDMIMFCESFQYINIEKALANSEKLLNKDGYILISDVFKKNIEGSKAMRGGHKLEKFLGLVEKSPFKQLENVDITEQTAPNMDMESEVMEKVAGPVMNAGLRFFQSRHPMVLKILMWKYRKEIEKMEKKYLGGGRTGEDFRKFKTYQMFLYQKQNSK
jgi:SAM-dependent methyltransferase